MSVRSNTVTISEDSVLCVLKAHLEKVFPADALHRLRRATLAQIATVSAEEAGECLGMSARGFKTWAAKNGVPTLGLGYKTPRYAVRAIAKELEKRSITPKGRLAVFVTPKKGLDGLTRSRGERGEKAELEGKVAA